MSKGLLIYTVESEQQALFLAVSKGLLGCTGAEISITGKEAQAVQRTFVDGGIIANNPTIQVSSVRRNCPFRTISQLPVLDSYHLIKKMPQNIDARSH